MFLRRVISVNVKQCVDDGKKCAAISLGEYGAKAYYFIYILFIFLIFINFNSLLLILIKVNCI